MLEEILDDQYPIQGTMKNGAPYTIRLLRSYDVSLLYHFFSEIPRGDRLFFRDDVQDRGVVENWCANINLDVAVPLIVEVGGDIVGEASLHREPRGWKSHIGRVRLVIHPNYRRQGLSLVLLREIIKIALHAGSLERLMAECMETQIGAIRMFESAGFVPQATLEGHVRDIEGRSHNLTILTYDLRDQEYFAAD